ncbi:MAG: sigma-70 family RNA polymerase sigma factor [Candidatus Hydrogenedentes bacterium]|nr:sigma-70 family RNA polymerase sigma factor [Candidatus Hydrogenedentota bacterium]
MPAPELQEAGPRTRDPIHLAEHLFRHESGKLVSLLTRTFGVDRLQLAEDVVQETLIRALQTWPYHGIPDNPAAWITQTAKNLALDHVRRENNFRDKEPSIAASAHRWTAGSGDASDSIFFDDELSDNRLRMMFACCHPLIPQEARVALTLKTLCGFNIPEIAKAFLTTEAAVAKRLTRARQRIREARIPFEIPTGDEVLVRLESVEQSLYLLFNEGYKASVGESLIREELCREAIGLTNLLTQHPVGNQPRTHALLALMLLNAARLPARLDADGHILLLKEQDRSLWDQSLIAQGMSHLARSAAGDELSAFHLEARITACHCMARDYASTDWPRILSLYDRLAELDDSPVVALNRAVAVSQVHGPQAGIEAVESIPKRAQLFTYHLLYAVLGEFESQLDNHTAAASHFRRALDLTEVKSERLFLLGRIQACESRNGS